MTGALDFGHPGDGGLGDPDRGGAVGREDGDLVAGGRGPNGDPLPRPRERSTLVDHDGGSHGTVEVTRIRILPLAQVDDDVAVAEGEGFADAAARRRARRVRGRARRPDPAGVR